MDRSSVRSVYHFVANLYPFNQLAEELLNEICQHIRINHLTKDDYISSEQLTEGFLYIIRKGAIEQQEVNGVIQTKLDQGDVFGFSTLLGDAQQPHQLFRAKAVEDSVLYLLPANKFKELSADPLFAKYFAAKLQTRLKSAMQYALSPDTASLLQNVEQFCNKQIVAVNASCPIQQVARMMAESRNTSAVVMEHEKLVGFVSDRNFTKRVIAAGTDITLPIRKVMTENPPTIEATEIALQAVAKMMRYRIRNLPVLHGGKIVGVVNANDLVQKHSAQAVFLIDAIQRQNSVKGLASLMPQRESIFEALVNSEIRPHLVGQVMTMIADALTSRLIELAELMLKENGMGDPPCTYAWMAAGSQARYEMQWVSDQDNAIVLSNDISDKDKHYFHQLAEIVCNGLAACGYKLCPGDVMAANPKWCQSLRAWETYYTGWITYPELEALLNISIFLDIRHVHGEITLINQLQNHMVELVSDNNRFINALVTNMLRISPPIGFFRNFVLVGDGVNKDTLSIKKRAVTPVVDLARIYGLLAGSKVAGTHYRMQMALEKNVLNLASYEDLIGAYSFICSVRLRHQLKSLRNDQSINNHLPPKSLSQFERSHLKQAFWIINYAQQAAKQRFMTQGLLH